MRRGGGEDGEKGEVRTVGDERNGWWKFVRGFEHYLGLVGLGVDGLGNDQMRTECSLS